MRRERGLTQQQLADRMNVTQATISNIENGKTHLVSLLTDYALEVGARVRYVVERAEERPEGDRAYPTFTRRSPALVVSTWDTGGTSVDEVDKNVSYRYVSHDCGTLVGAAELMGNRPSDAWTASDAKGSTYANR